MADSNFEKALRILHDYGIDASHVAETTRHLSAAVGQAAPGERRPVVLSNDPAESSVPPRFIEVETVDDLKRIGGVPDSFYDAGWTHERELPQAASAAVLNTDDPLHPDICAALRTFVFGDSRKVASYRDAVNRLRFPMKVATFAADDLTVTRDQPLIVRDADGHGNPINLVFDHVTVYAGGEIVWQAPGKMTCTSITYSDEPGPATQAQARGLAAGAAGGSSYISQGGDGGEGGGGGPGPDMPKAASGNAGADNKNKCDRAATSGKPGSPGGDGGDGSDGGPGGDAEEIYVDVDELNGTIPVGSCGGKGGRGGDGGRGGKGGDGGDGGAGTKHCDPGTGGPGGRGGKAGKGGDGGKGGNGNRIFITYKTGTPSFQQVSKGGGGGAAGDAGGKGAGGAGGNPGGDGGGAGDKADPATAGTGGKPGTVFINGKKLDDAPAA